MTLTTLKDVEAKLAIATEALRKAEERATAGQLALEVMHEIQNPLQAMQHLAYLTLQEADSPAKVRLYMGLAEEQLTTLAHITTQTLGFARSSQARQPIDLAAWRRPRYASIRERSMPRRYTWSRIC